MLLSSVCGICGIGPGNLHRLVSTTTSISLTSTEIVIRNIVKPLVEHIPGNIHKGFERRYEAERAYVLAFAMGGLWTLPRRGAVECGPPPASPTPQEVMDAFAAVPDDFLGAEWYVVYKGRRPGLYPSW